MQTKRILLPYGSNKNIEVEIPCDNLIGAFSSKDIPNTITANNLIEFALEHPIGSASLRDLAASAKNILLVVDDNTRRTPVHQILPVLTKILNQAGVSDNHIRILFAAGTHREMSIEEQTQKIGKEAITRFECTGHDYLGECISLGHTKYGTPVEVNPLLKWSDLTIAIGSIIPHAYCGWGGGGKMILPGVSSAKSILATHMLPFQNPEIGIGVLNNQARTEIDEASQMAGLRFIVNTILNSKGEIVDIVAGSVIPAHREGIKKATAIHGVKIPEKADLVFGCSYPEFSCYWQANKAFHPMEKTVLKGGLAVMIASMPEGRGEHPSCFDAMGENVEKLIQHLNEIKDKDLDEALAIACALADRKLQNKARVGIVSDGLAAADTANGVFIRYKDPNDAVVQILREKRNARILCLINASEMLPIFSEEAALL
ncbi:MAG: nickel-dependent lactate racemase [bacterium]|nr:nickel-dependent lactate racemase [bacterium]